MTGPAASLWQVEVRKLVDTRASQVVLATLWLVALAVGTLAAVSSEAGRVSLQPVLAAMQFFVALAAATIGILGVTGDWAHRVTTSYFPLVRSRSHVYLAKIAASLTVSVALIALTMVSATLVVATVARATSRSAAYGSLTSTAANGLVITIMGTWFGVGIASVLRRPAAALVAVVLLTVGVNAVALTLLPEGLQPVLSTLTPVAWLAGVTGAAADATTGEAVPFWQALASLTLWYVAPLALGWRIALTAEA